jgi:sulfur carrier protein
MLGGGRTLNWKYGRPELLTAYPGGQLGAATLPSRRRARGIIHLVIQVTVNGAAHRFEAPLNLSGVLEKLAMAGKKIAVERNGEIVPKGQHANTLVQNGDQLEIVVAVGGG